MVSTLVTMVFEQNGTHIFEIKAFAACTDNEKSSVGRNIESEHKTMRLHL